MKTACYGLVCCLARPSWWCSDMLQNKMSLMEAVNGQQGVDAEERAKELKDALEFAFQCEADTRRWAAANAALAKAQIDALKQRLADEEGRAQQVTYCVVKRR